MHLWSKFMDVYFSDLFLKYDNEKLQFEWSLTASVHSEEAPIAGRNLIKTVLVSLFLCIEKLEKFVGLNLSRKWTT